ncbi:MAG: histidinol-phosphate transaminase [Gammaproteobacteria bacterium]|jgi:histidinol-phosphate aminotransferase
MGIDFIARAHSGVQGLRPYEPGKPVEELERELGISEALKLASNENPLGPGERAMTAIRAYLDGVAFYPDGNGFALKRGLAEKLGVDPAWITLGNGSNDVLDLVARAYLGPGRNAVFSQHAFAVYFIVTRAVGAEAKPAVANPPDHAQPYGHDLDAMAEGIDAETGVVFIANPNNPTGTWLTSDALRAFLRRVPEEVLVVVDEAYCEYVTEPDYPNALQWLEEFPNLVVTRTFSKIHGLAGLRVGYAVSNPQVADILNRVRQPFNTNILGQMAALAALDDEDHVRRSVEVNHLGLEQLRTGCETRGLRYIPSVGNFLTVDVGHEAGAIYQALLREGIIVRPIAAYGLPQHLRFSVGTETQNARALQALDKVLDS